MSKTRNKQELIMGKWNEDGTVFTASDKQPEPGLTDTGKMVKWAAKTYKEEAGEYSFVRKIPGRLMIAVQQVFSAEFE